MLYPSVIKNDSSITIKERLKYFIESFKDIFKMFSNVSLLALFMVQKFHF